MLLKNDILSDLQMIFFTKAIIICITEWNLNDNYELVYTPESTDKYKAELTNGFIDIADLIILSIDAGSMTAKTMSLINTVFKKANCSRENIFIAVNQLYNMNRSLKNWRTDFLESLKYLSGKFAYSNPELAEKNVCPVFSYLFSLLIDYNNMKENDNEIKNATLDVLECITGLSRDKIKQCINDFNITGTISDVQYSDEEEISLFDTRSLGDDIENDFEQKEIAEEFFKRIDSVFLTRQERQKKTLSMLITSKISERLVSDNTLLSVARQLSFFNE